MITAEQTNDYESADHVLITKQKR